ncbi:hypothetical protein GUJ93_ZPchr1380g7105 [Zizania palustris]|uniref:Uncharacterized protein n=1 Tax=Zizania palustris TaxID=103762 RepID=A0A8J5UWA1_ZIZPA|nr:hypothetical protein GUJ93_ZPchr1380g7105 [Zizania palustris]
MAPTGSRDSAEREQEGRRWGTGGLRTGAGGAALMGSGDGVERRRRGGTDGERGVLTGSRRTRGGVNRK